VRIALCTAAFSKSMMARGVLAGVSKPKMVTASYPGTPDSAMVGISGATAERLVLEMPSARRRPA
jgi:hypothetical protein